MAAGPTIDKRMPVTDTPRARVCTFALGLPGAYEEFPWGERVVEVHKKVFVFLGMDTDNHLHLSVKLPVSRADALESGFGTPTGYGLGKSGWVSLKYEAGDRPNLPQVCAWVEESYRAIAPKARVAELDGRSGSKPPEQ